MIEKIKDHIDRSPYSAGMIASFWGILTFLLRVPFIFRYDLFFGSDPGICYLMPLRILHGDRPFYFYGQDFQGATEAYLVALLFKLFNPSIPLAAAFSLFQWSAAVAVGVHLLVRATNKFEGAVGGLFAAVGVPYTLVYVTVPYIGYPGSFLFTMLILLMAFLILDSGPTPLRFLILGLTIGAGLFIGKQCLPAVGAAVLALLLFRTAVWGKGRFLRPLFPLAGLAGFIIGYSPEILYRFCNPTVKNFSNMADFHGMWSNFKQYIKSLYAYFNAHEFSRIPEDIYFYRGIPFNKLTPHNLQDFLSTFLGLMVLIFIFKTLVTSFVKKNTPLFLMTALFFINSAAVVASKETMGDIFHARRYLHSSAIVLSFMTGLFFIYLRGRTRGLLRSAVLAMGALFLARSIFDQYSLLQLPDSLREIRWVIQDMRDRGYDRGISYWGPSYAIDALSNEGVIIAERGSNRIRIKEYPQIVSKADRIAVIGYKDSPPEKEIAFDGSIYRPAGPAHENILLVWTPYQKDFPSKK